MTFIEKVKEMLGFHSKPKGCDNLTVDVSRAIQRNEMSSDRARRALEDLKQSDVLRQIAGKM